VEAYKKHETIKRHLIADELPFEKEDKLIEAIIQGAMLKFSIKRTEFEKMIK
jgi:coproporphyrinogen III oxidase-like Fe-S oxidoreductase